MKCDATGDAIWGGELLESGGARCARCYMVRIRGGGKRMNEKKPASRVY